ncbi:hypothetical protein MRS44_013446 [Fusarium solani]|uniref:uncharacterized protein n=1 Tax=Fusarium solani TaxID=169388 RepID=UPI0032C3F364|nr:hypothetical protein MRS44_013446 [Fusarium solani]
MSDPIVIHNPIISGFYPDPSCIRVGDTFYMVNSSFQVFPGLPIHRSTDLVHWELIGHAICRPRQLDLTFARTIIINAPRREIYTAGLYAPTIRHHGNKFYIVCTNLRGSQQPNGHSVPQNFIITCEDLTDPSSFSDPIYFDFHGIDPSLFFDDDGKAYVQGSYIIDYDKHPATVIKQAQINPNTGAYESELEDIWTGAGGKCPEGPHLYKKDGSYWLLIAEGGTHRGHRITMARSDHVWGPYESFERNPVLISQSDNHIIQCVGHGELFEDAYGRWWCCMLARREYGPSYPLGRETFLTSVSWPKGEFPTITPVELLQVVGTDLHAQNTQAILGNTLPSARLVTLQSPHTLFLRTPSLKNYNFNSKPPRFDLRPTDVPLTAAEYSPTFVGQRQMNLHSEARVVVDLGSLPQQGHCGLSLYKDTHRHASLDINSDKLLSLAIVHGKQPFQYLHSRSVSGANLIKLIIRSSILQYTFSYDLLQDGKWLGEATIGEVGASDMSGDDFTGTLYGIYASGMGEVVSFGDFSITEPIRSG